MEANSPPQDCGRAIPPPTAAAVCGSHSRFQLGMGNDWDRLTPYAHEAGLDMGSTALHACRRLIGRTVAARHAAGSRARAITSPLTGWGLYKAYSGQYPS